jgi:hypothetical protein
MGSEKVFENEEYDDTYQITIREIISNLLLFPNMINNNYIKEMLRVEQMKR